MGVLGIDLGKDRCFVLPYDRRYLKNLDDFPYLKDQQLFLKGMYFIGTDGKKKRAPNPKIISLIKRLIGRPFSDPELQQDLKSVDILVTEGPDGSPLIRAEHFGQLRRFTPIQVMEIAFSNIKTLAEMKFNTTIVDCCIAIPIYFTDFQRRAFMHAACNSGLNPLMLMHETTASAVDYGHYLDVQPDRMAFVDIGHASMQVCIAGVSKDQCEVLSHSFDRCLGGRDFDEVLFQHFAEKFKLEYKIDVLQNVQAEVRLRRECERLKVVLSEHQEAPMYIKRLMEGKDVRGFITRQEFLQISAPILERVKKPLEEALAEAQLTVDDIMDFQVAGLGASVPAVRNILFEFFPNWPRLHKDGTHGRVSSVSRGCALQCAILSPRSGYRRLLFQERLPFSIALKLNDMSQGSQTGTDQSIIFHKGNRFPCQKALTFVRSATFSVDLEYTDFGELKALPTISRYTIGPFQATNAERAKVMVKVLLNMHGIVSVDSAQLIEEEEGAVDTGDNAVEMETDTKVESPKKVKNSNIPVCVIEERMAKKNALKAYVYDMRVKLYDELFEFVTVSDREQFIAKLLETMDWLCGDGEDASDGVYVAKLDELKEQGDPIEQRFKDHVIEETKAKKDAVDAYVNEMMKNLYGKLSEFVTDSDKEKLIGKLEETMDWLHGDGEDEMKGVYVAKLDELKKQGDPIEQRYKEHCEREPSVSKLTERANWYKKAAFDTTNYSHIDEDGRKTIVQACSNAEKWLKIAQLAQGGRAKHDAPLLLLADIRNMVEELDGVCTPILFPGRSTNETDAGTKHGVVDTRDNSVKMETDTKTMSDTKEEIKKMKLSSKKKKSLRRNRRKKNHHSQEDQEEEPVSSSYPPPALLRVEIKQLIDESLKRSYPKLLDLVGDFVTVEGDALVMYGDDYQCPNVVHVCNKKREEQPDLFMVEGTEDIAKDFMSNLMKSEMIQQVTIRGGCFVSFKLAWEWMAKRIENMLEDGIGIWAPNYFFKVVALEIPAPTINSHVYADFIRSKFIRDSLASMLEYSGVSVRCTPNYESADYADYYAGPEIAEKFSVQHGEYRKRVDGLVAPPLFVLRTESGSTRRRYSNVDLDFGTLWCGRHLHKADFIVYITPERQRGYIEKCFDAARDVKWLMPDTAICCGYWTSSNEKEKLARLIYEFEDYSKTASLMELAEAAGYSFPPVDVFECALRYAYLKTDRLVDCTTTVEEMFDLKGNTFVYLLNTLVLAHSIIKNPGQEMFKLKNEFLNKERDLGLHIVRFSDVVKESCTRFLPHLMCDYLYDLCKKFTSCYSEVRPVATRLLLCKATASVMEKCFLLLKITPEPSTVGLLADFFDTKQDDSLSYFIPWPVSDPYRDRNPRIEMISMHIGMNVRGFVEGEMFGCITVSDTYRPQPHGWSLLYARDTRHVAYFDRTWCEPVSINDSSLLFFGDPSTPQLVAFGSSVDIVADLMVTCKSNGVHKDACYTISKIKHKLKLDEFWEEEYRGSKCDTMCLRSKDAIVSIYYILFKDAVDVKMDFRCVSRDSLGLRVRGQLHAYYEDVLDDVKGDEMLYKAVIFQSDDARVIPGDQIQLEKSVFAVPSNGRLTIAALLEDVNSGSVIVDEKRTYRAIPQGSMHWRMRGPNSNFILTMEWSTGNAVIDN